MKEEQKRKLRVFEMTVLRKISDSDSDSDLLES